MRLYLPRRGDFFPKTERGHGTTHPQPRVRDGVKIRNASPCVVSNCSGDHSDAKETNVLVWKSERLFPKSLPLEQCR